MSLTNMFPLVGLLLLVLGWPLATRRVRPNRWYGLRLPATFADERVWYDANAVTGRDMMRLGGVVLGLAIGLPYVVRWPDSAYAGVCGVVLGLGSLALGVRGWRAANRLLRERHVASRSAGGDDWRPAGRRGN
jgi:hypothetical protein